GLHALLGHRALTGPQGPRAGPTGPAAPVVGPARPWAIVPIRGELRRALVPRNWRPGCPVPLDDLRWLTVAYRGFDGRRHVGPIVVHEAVAEDVRWVFRRLFRAGFPIKRVALPRRYRDLPRSETWDDTRNVTSGFNCRPVTDGTSWSQHAYGLAIDINPLQNPYVRGDGSVLRRAARPYRDRTLRLPGMIHEGDVVVRAFDAIGWEWGGRWRTLKDYMHFSATGG
ncbi:MAG TPA: M15 family metallopeptidase, partial [Actinomycetota bacterium]|nr:M15 family metallopeptidase [Actinomycetota bacterium]